MNTAKKQRKTHVNFRLDAQYKQVLEDVANSTKTSKANVIRKAVSTYLELNS